ncbi:Hypothetical predicted protein [Pelobates cultripes]|uniref:Uncharacterized protein n=1 Tax=Pelobates cultripes TaxID=61616 RepID=A0AAD1VZM7_PELCU|nr:Hypothetical predicted protein [Pelobates cultripes]
MSTLTCAEGLVIAVRKMKAVNQVNMTYSVHGYPSTACRTVKKEVKCLTYTRPAPYRRRVSQLRFGHHPDPDKADSPHGHTGQAQPYLQQREHQEAADDLTAGAHPAPVIVPSRSAEEDQHSAAQSGPQSPPFPPSPLLPPLLSLYSSKLFARQQCIGIQAESRVSAKPSALYNVTNKTPERLEAGESLKTGINEPEQS